MPALPMLPPLPLTTFLLGVALAVVILYLVRRDHLYLMHGLLWSMAAGAALLLGAWPGLIDWLAKWLGVAYPPALLLLLACMALLLKALHADMVCTRLERDVRRLNQRLALLEAEMAGPGPGHRPTGVMGAARAAAGAQQGNPGGAHGDDGGNGAGGGMAP